MYPVVIVLSEVAADLNVELGQRQRWWGNGFARIARRDVPGQGGQELGGDCAEYPFDFPLPRGFPGVLWISCTFTSAQTCARWSLVKSLPWSLYNAAGNPHTGQPGSVFRQIACRNANAVCNAVGSPRNTVYPATARE
jgi:hypothetical protein